MSVKIRLSRTGKTHQVSYRIVAQDTRTKRDGRFLEILGFYNPNNKPSFQIDREKLAAWTKKGAKPTIAVETLLNEGKLTKKVKKPKEEPKPAAAPQASDQNAEGQKPEERKAESTQEEKSVNTKSEEQKVEVVQKELRQEEQNEDQDKKSDSQPQP